MPYVAIVSGLFHLRSTLSRWLVELPSVTLKVDSGEYGIVFNNNVKEPVSWWFLKIPIDFNSALLPQHFLRLLVLPNSSRIRPTLRSAKLVRSTDSVDSSPVRLSLAISNCLIFSN